MDINSMYSCNGQPQSEEYADFIVEFGTVPEETIGFFNVSCIQGLGRQFTTLYAPLSEVSEYIADGLYSYYNIPKLYTFDNTLFTVTNSQMLPALEVSGIERVKRQPYLSLTGRNVVIGIVDAGVDIRETSLRYNDGTTRIRYLWDQSAEGEPPAGFSFGTEFDEIRLNEILSSGEAIDGISANEDITRHGTLLLKAACGRIDSDDLSETFEGVAPDASIVVVKLKEAKRYLKEHYCISEGTRAYQENDIMAAVNYIRRTAMDMGMPSVIMLSCSTSMGGHTGSLPLDVMSGIIADTYGTCLLYSTGEEADKRRHFHGNIRTAGMSEAQSVELRVGTEEDIYMELWSNSPEVYTVGIVSPSGEIIERVPRQTGHAEYSLVFETSTVIIENKIVEGRDNTRIVIIRIKNPSVGIWRINVYGENIVTGEYDLWLPSNDFISRNTYFLEPEANTTLVSPAATERALTIGGFAPLSTGILAESGRGFTRNNRVKPDVAAPVVNNGIVDTATAIGAGAAALYMEWAVVRRNALSTRTGDVKNFFIVGANRDENADYPSETYGYGRLNLYNSFSLYR